MLGALVGLLLLSQPDAAAVFKKYATLVPTKVPSVASLTGSHRLRIAVPPGLALKKHCCEAQSE